MAKSKKNDRIAKKPSVKVNDLTPKKDPMGGFSKIEIDYIPIPPPKK